MKIGYIRRYLRFTLSGSRGGEQRQQRDDYGEKIACLHHCLLFKSGASPQCFGLPRPRRSHRLGARRSALGARRSALGARRSALGARRSALGARRSALGARRSALGARRSALGARRSALGARRSALGARRSALGARRSALGARRSALGARRSALGARRSALGARCRVVLLPRPRRSHRLGARRSALGIARQAGGICNVNPLSLLPPTTIHSALLEERGSDAAAPWRTWKGPTAIRTRNPSTSRL